ncbi:hypothetical protein CHARACLAT_029192 [Characodon lateralis]|uniref:Uncharacterized protein n=1 Tax=Characodon lateralis TaxID=208331 RepID=A0ABU7DLA0_9TELE|nr:hypothetical protein [Characodon lateralis]
MTARVAQDKVAQDNQIVFQIFFFKVTHSSSSWKRLNTPKRVQLLLTDDWLVMHVKILLTVRSRALTSSLYLQQEAIPLRKLISAAYFRLPVPTVKTE